MPVDSLSEPSQLSENYITLSKTSVPLANDNNKLNAPKNNSSSQIALISQNTSWFRLVCYHAVGVASKELHSKDLHS